MDDPQSCETYLRLNVLQPMGIPDRNYIAFKSNDPNPAHECERVQRLIKQTGPIDLCILGIGMNGHIALNEPAEYLQPHCHVASLSPQALNHSMAKSMISKPTYGLTIGMADILNSKLVLLIINDGRKAEITREFMKQKISTNLPASFLWLHPNIVCVCHQDAYNSE